MSRITGQHPGSSSVRLDYESRVGYPGGERDVRRQLRSEDPGCERSGDCGEQHVTNAIDSRRKPSLSTDTATRMDYRDEPWKPRPPVGTRIWAERLKTKHSSVYTRHLRDCSNSGSHVRTSTNGECLDCLQMRISKQPIGSIKALEVLAKVASGLPYYHGETANC
jgi:hypothetical protein